MRTHTTLFTAALVTLGAAGFYYERKINHNKHLTTMTGDFKGYSNMMKLAPEYYNETSMEAQAFRAQDFNPTTGIDTPWVMGVNAGDGSEVSAGWTAWPDQYSSQVSSQWQSQMVEGSHL